MSDAPLSMAECDEVDQLPSPFQVDPREQFESWLTEVGPGGKPQGGGSVCSSAPSEPCFLLESFDGSDCAIQFDGLLHVEGPFTGCIDSEHGVLVVSRNGCLDADVHVGAAIIDGLVRANIAAQRWVVLEENAHVIGDILTPSLIATAHSLLQGRALAPNSPFADSAQADQ